MTPPTDVRDVDLSHAHMLSGPIYVEGAEPGDLLVVDILDFGPVPQAIWDVSGQKCSSRHTPGVEFTAITHPGLFGTAPSPELPTDAR